MSIKDITQNLINDFRSFSGVPDEAQAVFLIKNPTGYQEKYLLCSFIIRQEKPKSGGLIFYLECPNTVETAKIFNECSLVVFRDYSPALDNKIYNIGNEFEFVTQHVVKYPITPSGEKYS